MNIDVLKSIDFKRLQIFLTVVECQSFAHAQDKLDISAASISLHMTELERSLGMVLCKRGRSGFSLTLEGERVCQAAQSLLVAHSEFNSIVSETRGVLEGEIRIGLIDQLVFDSAIDLPGFLDELNSNAPGLKPSLFTMSPSELTRAIATQDIHLGIGVFYDRSPHLRYQTLCNEKLSLYCSEKHKLFDINESELSISKLENESFVERSFGETLPITNVPLPMKPTVYSSSLETTLLLILSGNHIGFLSDYYAKTWLDRNQLRSILQRDISINVILSAVTHHTPEDSLLCNTAIELLQRYVTKN